MKALVVYSSRTGNSRKIAEAIAAVLPGCEIHPVESAPAPEGYDLVAVGYWVDKGGPNQAMRELMEILEGKTVGVFCTLGYYADAAHGVGSIQNGVNLLKDKNTILGSYVCNGAISDQIIAMFRRAGGSGPHSATPESEIRWEILKDHPTQTEMALGLERFNERLEILRRFQNQGLEFRSIV